MRYEPDEDLMRALPLPLAQLYRRSTNAKTPLERHQGAYYLWESSLKLLGSVAVLEWARRGVADADTAECLKDLARPSLGHWWEFVRRLVPSLADSGDRAFGELRDLLLAGPRHDLPRAAGLDSLLRESLGMEAGSRSMVRPAELFDRLIRYRNRELGHGAAGQKAPEFYDRMGRAILAAMGELLARASFLARRKLVYIDDVRRLESGGWVIERYELAGESPRRLESLTVPADEAPRLPRPGRLYLSGRSAIPPENVADRKSVVE